MKNVMFLLLAISMILLSGCSSTLRFKENFDGYSGTPQEYPSGPPDQDMIKVRTESNPLVEGGWLKFKSATNNSKTFFISHPIKNADSERTFSWKGSLLLDDKPIWFFISAGDIPSSGDQIDNHYLKLQIWQSEAIFSIKTPYESKQLESIPLSSSHEIYLVLKPKSYGYKLSISSYSTGKTVRTGTLNPQFINWIKDHPRMLLQAIFPPYTTISKYNMDSMIMREKK